MWGMVVRKDQQWAALSLEVADQQEEQERHGGLASDTAGAGSLSGACLGGPA